MTNLEKSVSDFTGVKNVVFTGSGTNALICSFKALELPLGSEVIIPSYVCFSVPMAVHLSGLKPVMSDVLIEDYTIDPESVKALITKKTSAIIVVHTFGNTCKIKKIKEIADDYNLTIIEDFCHSFNGLYNGKKHGSFGKISVTSFSSRKLFSSEGGAVITDDEKIYSNAKLVVSKWKEKDKSLDLENIRSNLEDSFLPLFTKKTGYNFDKFLPFFFNLIYRFRPSLFIYNFSPSWIQDLKEDFDKFPKENLIRERNSEFFYRHINTIGINLTSRKRKSGTSMYFSFMLKSSRRRFKEVCFRLYPELTNEHLVRFAYSASHFSKFNQEQEFPNSNLVRTRIVNLVIHPSLSKRKIIEIAIKIKRVLTFLSDNE